jgi:hypothetical protein
MSVPRVIFVDTRVFDEQRYNFQSAAMMAFLEATKTAPPTLLLPAPTEQEITRHIQEQVDEASKVLSDAKRRAPILAKWTGWPANLDARDIKYQLHTFAQTEWKAFLGQFDVKRLGYEGVNLSRIMNWYEFKRAPFGVGKKSKEFPDAIAVDAIAFYAAGNDTEVAMISKDPDFKQACTHYSRLLYFSSLSALTEAILSVDTSVAALKALLNSDVAPIAKGIEEGFTDCSFYPEHDPMGDVEDVTVNEVEVTAFNVIALGECECKIAFEARVSYSASVSFDDPDSLVGDSEDGYFALRRLSGTVSDSSEMSGVSKLKLDAAGQNILGVIRLEFDDDNVCVAGIPENGWSDDWADDDRSEEEC